MISAITSSEFLEGVFRAPAGKRQESRRGFFEVLVASHVVFPFGIEEAKPYARMKADLSAQGVAIGAQDILIAATLHQDFDLATLNTAEFSRIPGLQLSPAEKFLR